MAAGSFLAVVDFQVAPFSNSGYINLTMLLPFALLIAGLRLSIPENKEENNNKSKNQRKHWQWLLCPCSVAGLHVNLVWVGFFFNLYSRYIECSYPLFVLHVEGIQPVGYSSD